MTGPMTPELVGRVAPDLADAVADEIEVRRLVAAWQHDARWGAPDRAARTAASLARVSLDAFESLDRLALSARYAGIAADSDDAYAWAIAARTAAAEEVGS